MIGYATPYGSGSAFGGKGVDRHQGLHHLVGWRGETIGHNRRDSAAGPPPSLPFRANGLARANRLPSPPLQER